MNNRVQIHYRVDEAFEPGSWQDKLTRNSHIIVNERYKVKTHYIKLCRNFKYIDHYSKAKRSKNLGEKKKERFFFKVDISLRDFHPSTFGK